MKLKLLAASIIAASLVGCGSDNDSDGNNSISISSSSTSSVVSSSSVSSTANTSATFAGLEGTVANDTATLSGTVTVTDPDAGEDTVVALTDATATYGTFTIDADGAWTYTLDTAGADVAALDGADDTLTDTIAIESADGTAATVTITVTGVDAAGGANKYAAITDTTDGDTGELRYALDDDGPLSSGKITLSFLKDSSAVWATRKPGDEDEVGTPSHAFITLFNENTNNAGAIIDFRVKGDAFEIRDQDIASIDDGDIVPNNDQWQDVEITWNTPDGETLPVITVTIDGEAVTTDPFTAQPGALGGVTHVSFRHGFNTETLSGGAFKVDNLKVYSDVAGTALVFEDDFESYSVDESLDAEPYHSNTHEAVVAGSSDGGEGGSGGTGGSGGANKAAFVDDSTTDDAGEIRVSLGDGQLAGRLTASMLRTPITAAKDGEEKNPDAYVTLFNSTGSTSGNRSILDLKVRDSGFEIRDADDLDIETAMVLDQWFDVEVTWTAPDATTLSEVTIKIDGEEVAGGTFTTTGTSSADEDGSVTNVAFRIGDSGTVISSGGIYVDDIVIYDAVDGGSVVFSEDFEGMAVDTDLVPTEDNASVFADRTQDATVAEIAND
ncbi:VCBS domain-containing protein [Gilvimarinus agarilyticus]|uniref:VCBS domain-containing protein n=1 Tax=unclassified Gilvimarinus TaxID=2642066 RepID=UPI001C082469|nr:MULTISPECIES: VCBS domain-containing protein [unclassified Gilvimarinus]MBU2887447.1 VCBS domain-containing protein [Gilvimarinus agarilyticus]MDO6572106.1 VCBS domain-containing protein [Gilvimarinus sp. 2_MG-2023]MDO6746167.1 VCBS domain-containing protein [Gilvimarinus sp. 1_MG-2023]